MAVELQELFTADAAEAVGRRRDDTQLATARQRDGAGQDMRVVGGMIAKELLVSDSPDDMSRINAAVRIPTTVDHPNAVVTPKA
jgi:hypothetical protein